jgi:hypothetical protein
MPPFNLLVTCCFHERVLPFICHNKNFWEKKNQKKQEQGAAMFGAAAPVLAY